ncbi:hypothetical protein HK102_012576, partial [Quaeritorhiza haematococci]
TSAAKSFVTSIGWAIPPGSSTWATTAAPPSVLPNPTPSSTPTTKKPRKSGWKSRWLLLTTCCGGSRLRNCMRPNNCGWRWRPQMGSVPIMG